MVFLCRLLTLLVMTTRIFYDTTEHIHVLQIIAKANTQSCAGLVINFSLRCFIPLITSSLNDDHGNDESGAITTTGTIGVVVVVCMQIVSDCNIS